MRDTYNKDHKLKIKGKEGRNPKHIHDDDVDGIVSVYVHASLSLSRASHVYKMT